MKRIRTVLFSFAAGLALTGLTACGSLLEPRDVQEPDLYDIGKPERPFDGIRKTVIVRPFRLDSPSKQKMTVRIEKNQVVPDTQNLWAMPPGLLLSRYLTQAFSGASADAAQKVVISGQILNFELDLTKKEVFFSVATELDFGNGLKKTYTDSFTVPVQENTAPDFSEAMGKAVARYAELLRKRI